MEVVDRDLIPPRRTSEKTDNPGCYTRNLLSGRQHASLDSSSVDVPRSGGRYTGTVIHFAKTGKSPASGERSVLRTPATWMGADLNLAEVSTPAQLLEKIGRGAEKRLAQHAESWDALSALWMKGGAGVKDSGLSVMDRR